MCWNCGKSGHYEEDCRQKWTQNKEWSGKFGKSKGKNKGKGKLNSVENWQEAAQGDEHADGWIWSDEQAEEWWKLVNRTPSHVTFSRVHSTHFNDAHDMAQAQGVARTSSMCHPHALMLLF